MLHRISSSNLRYWHAGWEWNLSCWIDNNPIRFAPTRMSNVRKRRILYPTQDTWNQKSWLQCPSYRGLFSKPAPPNHDTLQKSRLQFSIILQNDYRITDERTDEIYYIHEENPEDHGWKIQVYNAAWKQIKNQSNSESCCLFLLDFNSCGGQSCAPTECSYATIGIPKL